MDITIILFFGTENGGCPTGLTRNITGRTVTLQAGKAGHVAPPGPESLLPQAISLLHTLKGGNDPIDMLLHRASRGFP
ncbi:hypothetical protein, partial [Pantoea piersonii]|uniref:hypothetical protein n=1 Tax=Pantoea piersonii TaxID=2364647 RepID=UPI0028A12B76